MKKNNFYIYALLDPRKPGKYGYKDICFLYEPFYIGKGTGNRCYDHFKPSQIKRCKNPHLCRKIVKIKKMGEKVIVQKIKTGITEKECFKLEIKLINLLGKSNNNGILTNIYDGGYGKTKSLETKQKISQSVKKWHQQNISPCLGKKHSEKTRKKISKARKGLRLTKEWKQKISQTKCFKKTGSLWYTTISPQGLKFKVLGLPDFCKKHNLCPAHMSAVANKNRKHHKGWKCEYYLDDMEGRIKNVG
jgi:hypothetical protein